MNTQQARRQDQLRRFLDALGLCEENKNLAEEYLLADERNDSLLAQPRPEDLKAAAEHLRTADQAFMEKARNDSDREMLNRCIRLFWAIGKSTAVYPLKGDTILWHGKLLQDCLPVVGKAASAAMLAEDLSGQSWGSFSSREWLYTLAETEPEVLEQAQTLGGTSWDNMRVMLAGILLCKRPAPRTGLLQKLAGGDALAARQAKLVAENNRDSLEAAAPGLTAADRRALTDWMEKGRPLEPLPALSVALPDSSDPDALFNSNRSPLNRYLTGLLSTASFLGQRQDPRLRCAVRMYLALNPEAVLQGLLRNIPMDYLLDQLDTLVQDVPGGEVTFLLALAKFGTSSRGMDQGRQLAARCVGGARQALKLSSEGIYNILISLLPDDVVPHDEKEIIAAMLEKLAQTGKQELRAFLLGEGSLAHAARQLAPVTANGYLYAHNALQAICRRRDARGWDDFVCRCVVAVGLCFKGTGLSMLFGKDVDFALPVQALLERKLPVEQLLDVLGGAHDSFYREEDKTRLRDMAYKAFARPEYRQDLCGAAVQSGVFGRCVALSALDDLTALPGEEGDAAKAGILSAAGDSSKQVQELLVAILSAHADWTEDVIALLGSKKAAERLLAVRTAARMGDTLRPALEKALEGEKSAKVADAIRTVLGRPAVPVAQTGEPTPEELAAGILKGGKRRRLQWLLEPPLPAVRRTDGSPAAEDLRDALLSAYCELGRIGRSDTAAVIARALDPADLAVLAGEVWERWMAAGAQSKTKWVLAFAAVFGGAAMTPRLQHAINDWPQHARGAIACDAVMALALSDDPAALLVVDSISRKFKFRQVKAAAAAALDNAAKELGITSEQLADRIIPDLGFSAEGLRWFDYGPRRFSVRLTPTLELSITNDAGKPVKNLPAPGKSDDAEKAAAAYDAFKTMKKQIRTTVAAQKARLEAALAAQRCWDAAAWKALFVGNPIMHQFAISLIWGVYREDRLTDTFRYMEDGSFNTAEEEEYTLPEDAQIGLVHPVELDQAALEAWKQQLEDYEITPSIPQLDRPVYLADDQEKTSSRLERFGGKKLNGLSLSGKLQSQGWYRGSVQDGGGFYTFYREDSTLGLGVELNFSGCFVGDENEEITVYDAVFYKAGTVRRGSYCYDTPKESDILLLGQVPARYYSEIVYQLTRATASSTETDPDWKTSRP